MPGEGAGCRQARCGWWFEGSGGVLSPRGGGHAESRYSASVNPGQWLAAAGIIVTLLIAAATWYGSVRRTQRDDLLQDLDIRDRLEPGVARQHLENSIDERVARMAVRAERARNDDLLDIGKPLTLAGFLGFFGGAFSQVTWVSTSGGVILVLGGVAWSLGMWKDTPTERRRLTPLRPPRAADAAAAPQTPGPAQPSTPGQRGWREWRRRRARPAPQPAARDAPPPRP